MCFIEYDGMVDALATDRADQALGVCILPRRSGSGGFVPDPHGAKSFLHQHAKNAVTIPDKITRRFLPWKRLCDLPGNPFRRGFPGYVAPDN
jgi:hypothetical protein